MFRVPLCTSSGEQDRVLLHVVFCTGCVGCGCVELSCKLCALCEVYCSNSNLHTVSCVHCVKFTVRTVTFTQYAHNLRPSSTQPQPAQPVQYTICVRARLKCDGASAETKFGPLAKRTSPFNLLTPNVNYSGRTAPLTSKVAFHIFIQQI